MPPSKCFSNSSSLNNIGCDMMVVGEMYNPNKGKVDIQKFWQIIDGIPNIFNDINDEVYMTILQNISDGEKVDVRSTFAKFTNDIYKEKIAELIDDLDSCVAK